MNFMLIIFQKKSEWNERTAQTNRQAQSQIGTELGVEPENTDTLKLKDTERVHGNTP